MKPYIVRARYGSAVIYDRETDNSIGVLWRTPRGDWLLTCDNGRVRSADRIFLLRRDAAEALWRHYLDEHKEQSQ